MHVLPHQNVHALLVVYFGTFKEATTVTLDLANSKALQHRHFFFFFTMAANPRSTTRVPPVVPKRTPATQLSMTHPVSSLSGGPSTVMLQPLHQAHGEAAAVGRPIEYISYVQETNESEAGQIETPEQKKIDLALTEETKLTDKVC